jgi:hypothetical protein
MTGKNENEKNKAPNRNYFLYLSLIFLVQFIITVTILFTDQNLQTDFGTVPRYFVHWYGLLVTGIVDLVAFAILLTVRKRPFVLAGVIWSIFMLVFQIADIATYGTLGVGLTASKFATYLFGFSRYPGALPYIPGLYDVLFAIYIIAATFGLYTYRKITVKQVDENQQKKLGS